MMMHTMMYIEYTVHSVHSVHSIHNDVHSIHTIRRIVIDRDSFAAEIGLKNGVWLTRAPNVLVPKLANQQPMGSCRSGMNPNDPRVKCDRNNRNRASGAAHKCNALKNTAPQMLQKGIAGLGGSVGLILPCTTQIARKKGSTAAFWVPPQTRKRKWFDRCHTGQC